MKRSIVITLTLAALLVGAAWGQDVWENMKAQEAKAKPAPVVIGAVPMVAVPSNAPCLIVKQNKGHRVRNAFLFGVSGLVFSKGERFEYVESFNLVNSKMKYKGGELQAIKDSGVHIIVVSEGVGEEVQQARVCCQAGRT